MADKVPLVSICLPVYNGARYLEVAIESALKQTVDDIELVIGDDGSLDGSLQIIQKYLEDQRIVFFRNPRRLGLFANYNECIKRAGAPLIKLFAQDDLLAPHAVARMKSVMEEQEDIALVSVARRWIDCNGTPIEPPPRVQPDRDFRLSSRRLIADTLSNVVNWAGVPTSVMFRRSAAGAGFDCRFRQIGDQEYFYRLLENGDYYFISEPLCDHRLHSASATSRNTPLSSLFDLVLIGHLYCDVLEESGESLPEYCRRMINLVATEVDRRLMLQASSWQESAVKLADARGRERKMQEFLEKILEEDLSARGVGMEPEPHLADDRQAVREQMYRMVAVAAIMESAQKLMAERIASQLEKTVESLREELALMNSQLNELASPPSAVSCHTDVPKKAVVAKPTLVGRGASELKNAKDRLASLVRVFAKRLRPPTIE